MKKAFIWKLLERFGVQGTQFIVQLVLARLLAPDLYGVLGIMIVFITVANVFIQTGFNTALIQNKDVKQEDYSSVLWVTMGIAGVLYALIFICSPIIGSFYETPELVTPLRVLAIMLFPGALNSVQLAKVSREMDFRKIFYSNIGAIVISGTAGIIIAVLGGGLWALVAQTMLNVIIATIVLQITSKLKIVFKIDFSRIKVLFSFGWKLLLSGLIDTIYQELQGLVIGKKFSNETLGFFNRGRQFPQFLVNSINGTVQSVMLPAMSEKQDNKGSLKEMMRNSISISAYIVFPMMAGLAGVAEPLIRVLLTDEWVPCVPYLQINCFIFAFFPMSSCNLQAINAIGRSDIFLKLEIIKKIYGAIALVIAIVFFDSPLAIAVTGLVTCVISVFVNAFPNKKLIDYSYFDQLKDILPSVILSLAMFAVVLLIGEIAIHPLLLLIIQIFAGVVMYFLCSEIFRIKPYLAVKKIGLDMIKKFLKKA